MDEFEARIRAARPASVRRGAPLSSRAKRELAELILSEPDYSSSPAPGRVVHLGRQRNRQVVARAFTAVLVAAATVVAVVLHQPVYALTPNLLATTPVSVSAPEALIRASENLRASDAVEGDGEAPATSNAGVISVQAWTLSSTDDGAQVVSAIIPENYVITRDHDGARTVVVTTGQAQHGDGSIVEDSDAEEGVLLWKESYLPGEYVYAFGSDAPTSPDEVGPFLSTVAGTDTSASAAIQAIAVLLMEQSLASSQEAALLEYLSGLPDISVVGQTTDRLGRPALVLSTPRADGSHTVSILISPEHGTILAIETIYTGTDRTDVRTPAVISYYAWNRN